MKFILIYFILSISIPSYAQSNCFSQEILDPSNFDLSQRDSFEMHVTDYVHSFLGCDVPDFNVIDINGISISSKSLHGKVVFLNFWFTKCNPCVREFTSLNKLAKEYGQDVIFISFVSDKKTIVDSFMITHPLAFTIIPSSDSITKNIFKVMAYPTNMIIDEKWKVSAIDSRGQTQSDESLKNYYFFAPLIDAAIKRKKER